MIERVDGALAAIEKVLIVLLTTALVGIMMAQVVLRYFFNAPIFWAEEVSVQLLVYMTLFGLSLLVRSDGLVCIDFVPRALSDRGRHMLLALIGVLMLAMLVYVVWLGWGWITRPEVRIEQSATLRFPRWYSYAVLPVAVAAMAWHQFAAVLRHLHHLRGVAA